MRMTLEGAPRDHATRYALAQKLLGAGQHDESIEELLLVLRKLLPLLVRDLLRQQALERSYQTNPALTSFHAIREKNVANSW